MKTIRLNDNGNILTLHVREDVELPALVVEEKPAHVQFIEWWRGQAKQRGVEYQYGIAEPQGHRIVQKLLGRYTLDRLKGLGVACFLTHGDKLREYPGHFAYFASQVDKLAEEYDDG